MGPAKKSAFVLVGLVITFLTIFIHLTFNHPTVWFNSTPSSFRSGSYNDENAVKDWSHVQQIQMERKKRLKQSCAALGYSPRFVTKNLDTATLMQLSRIQVIPELKAIYCPIPKVASTSWRRFLLNATGHDESGAVVRSKRVFPQLSSLPLKDARTILRTYQTFLFVRNPYVRILSAYKDKVLKEKYEVRELLEGWYKKHDPQEVKGMSSSDHFTFRQFVKHYIEAEKKNTHWEDMMELCHVCQIDYSFIGHLETLKDDSDYLIDLLNPPNGLGFPGERQGHQTNSSRDDNLQTFYSQLANGQYKDLSFSQGLARDALIFGYDTPESIERV